MTARPMTEAEAALISACLKSPGPIASADREIGEAMIAVQIEQLGAARRDRYTRGCAGVRAAMEERDAAVAAIREHLKIDEPGLVTLLGRIDPAGASAPIDTPDPEVETMLTRAGVRFTSDEHEVVVSASGNVSRHGISPGYLGFETVFTFDKTGALWQVGCWE